MAPHATANSNSSIASSLAAFKARTFGVLMGAATPGLGAEQGIGSFGALLAGRGQVGKAALSDPKAAFAMMSRINVSEVDFKAQFAELSAMQAELAEVRGDAARLLGGVNSGSDRAAVKSALQGFAAEYNEWVRHFDGDMKPGGILANIQAAQVSRFAMEISVSDIFTGATSGFRGLHDLGLEIDPATRLAKLDDSRFDAAFSRSPGGVIATVQELDAKFARAADLLNSDGNFLRNRLGNLDRAISYIDTNKTSWQAEFGAGKAATPTATVARALAAYDAGLKA